jgi:uncharacterized membrane protein
MDDSRKLFAIKAFHTLVWAFFAGCIVAIPLAVYSDNLRGAALLIALVLVEVLIIALNRGSCPLTAVAARYTRDRTDNFDIFLPAWLARYNKLIFGTLFAFGLVYAIAIWAGRQALPG